VDGVRHRIRVLHRHRFNLGLSSIMRAEASAIRSDAPAPQRGTPQAPDLAAAKYSRKYCRGVECVRQTRVVAWNSRFCELLDLPPDLTAGAPLRKILMLQAMRGDFGDGEPEAEVARRLEQFHRDVPAIKERVTPSGRILQISRRAMP